MLKPSVPIEIPQLEPFQFAEVAYQQTVDPLVYDLRYDKERVNIDKELRDLLVHRLRSYVLASEEITEHTQGVSWVEHRRPRWIPEFIWRRIPTEKCRVELKLKGRNLYPTPHPERIAGPAVPKHHVAQYLSPNTLTGVLDARQDRSADLWGPS